MSKCKCIIRHAITEKERKLVLENLRYARKIGDTNGIILSLAQIQPCPSQKRSPYKEIAELSENV